MEAAQDSVMRIRSRQIVTLELDSRNWEDRYNNQVALTRIEKKRKRKWMWIAIPAAGYFIYRTAEDIAGVVNNTP